MDSAISIVVSAAEGQKSLANIDSGVFREIYETYYKRVYNYISYRINNHHDVEDLVSQTFERVIQKYSTYDPKKPVFEAWLFKIARNTVTDYFRVQKKKFSISLSCIVGFLSRGGQPEEIVVINESNVSLVKALAKLSGKERNIVALKFAAGLKNKNIAEVMGISSSNVGTILFRSLRKLRKELEKEVQ